MIKINSSYYMKSDKYQWQLLKLSHKEGDDKLNKKLEVIGTYSEDTFTTVGYYYSFDQIAKAIVNKFELDDVEDLPELLDVYYQLLDALTNVLKGQENGSKTDSKD